MANQPPDYPSSDLPPPVQRPTDGWMSVATGHTNCPPGLEYLSTIDQLLVHQQIEWVEVFTGYEVNNRYIIKNRVGQNVYFAVEKNDFWTRNYGSSRPFEMVIMDNFRNEVIHLDRPLAAPAICDCCCPCWLNSIKVSAPPGTVVGSVKERWTMFKPRFDVKNAADDVVLKIEGPVCTVSCGGDVDFEVNSLDGQTNIGKITKQWSGLGREIFTDADYFGISFPMYLDVRIKAVLMGACFLIDYMFYEE